jgi:hypothetical protein
MAPQQLKSTTTSIVLFVVFRYMYKFIYTPIIIKLFFMQQTFGDPWENSLALDYSKKVSLG